MATTNVYAFGADETAEAEVTFGAGKGGEHTITAFAVLDADAASGDFPPTLHQTATGSLALWCKVWGSDSWEEVFQSDGTTQVTFDPTATKTASITLTGTYTAFKVEPSSLDADCVPYIAVSSDNRG